MKKIAVFLFCVCASFIVKGQDFGQIVAASLPDANKYATEYMRPFGEAQIYNQSRGWFSTAKVHKRLGFDISISGQFAIISSGKENFTFRNADYSTLKLSGTLATSATLPTFMGGTTNQELEVNTTANGQNVKAKFTAISGIGDELKQNISFLPLAAPLPVVQVGLGLFKHTEVKVRYFPKSNFNDVEIGVMGIAVQHEFSNYLPFIKKVPFLHLSALAGYTTTTATYKPEFGSGSPVQNPNKNALADYKISALTVQGIASVKLAFFEIYTSVGYMSGKSTLGFKGDYNITYQNQLPATGSQTVTVTDPINITYKVSGISNTWGARLNIFFLKIFADYTFAEYNGASAGIAFSFR
jgi:hypothetical protein